MGVVIGKEYNSNTTGPFVVIGKSDRKYKSKEDVIYKVKFCRTGYIAEASGSAILRGRVKDKMFPTVTGLGYIGDIDVPVTSPGIKFLYTIWNNMLNRCYNVNDSSYDLYGGIGVTVDPRWYCFSNFFIDAQELPGFENKLKYPDLYQLDKDYLQLDIPKWLREYSKDTCIWISNYDNVMLMNYELHPGYRGVIYRDGGYCCEIYGVRYGKFTSEIAAANMFNYMYPIVKSKYNEIDLFNDVEVIPFDELKNYAIPKNM